MRKKPSLVRKGIPADDVLNMRGRARENMTARRVISPSPLTVEWEYPDYVLTFRRRFGCYRVVDVKRL